MLSRNTLSKGLVAGMLLLAPSLAHKAKAQRPAANPRRTTL